jgi:hypothetical protein
MKARKGKLIIPKMGTNKRETISIKFTKSGVEQEWRLYFHSGRLLTDQVCVYYNPLVYLRSVEHCKTLEDVIAFLEKYSYDKRFTTISNVGDRDVNDRRLNEIKKILNLNINSFKLNGTLHWGRYTIEFKNGFVSYIRHYNINDGTFKITGVRDLILLTEKLIGKLDSYYEFALALKRIEVL